MKFTVESRSDHDSYRVVWYEDGQRRTKGFKKKIDAEVWAGDMTALMKLGSAPEHVVAAQRQVAGTGYALPDLVRIGLETMRRTGGPAGVTFADAAAKVIQKATASGARSRTLVGYQRIYATLNQKFGARVAATITPEEVIGYIESIGNRQGQEGKASASSRENYLRHLRMALRCAGVVDPLAGIEYKDEGDVEFFTVDECRTILRAAPRDSRGFVAVALFACVRPQNLELLPADCVSIKERRIRIPSSVSKDRETHLLERDIIPPVLWLWLRKYPFQPQKWSVLQRKLAEANGRWVHDGLRHSGATYYCALHGIAATARLLTHQGEQLVRKHYAGIVERPAALRFMRSKP